MMFDAKAFSDAMACLGCMILLVGAAIGGVLTWLFL